MTQTKRDRTRDHLLVSAQSLLMEYNAAALGIRQITTHAGMVHASFYNYYPDVSALIGDLAELLGATHAAAMARLVGTSSDPGVRFAQTTRHTLRIVAQQPVFGHFMFDVGLSADRLGSELRLRLNLDIDEGVAQRIFAVPDIKIAAGTVAGAITGLALDVHRKALPPTRIDDATEGLLNFLGVDPATARQLAHAPTDFPAPPELPMRWLSLPPFPRLPEVSMR